MYLLSTQCLLDRITGQAPASIDALPAREIHLSVVSLGQALLAIELDQALSPEALAFLNRWPDVNWVRMLPKLMDG